MCDMEGMYLGDLLASGSSKRTMGSNVRQYLGGISGRVLLRRPEPVCYELEHFHLVHEYLVSPLPSSTRTRSRSGSPRRAQE
jgi:hypothetical protein